MEGEVAQGLYAYRDRRTPGRLVAIVERGRGRDTGRERGQHRKASEILPSIVPDAAADYDAIANSYKVFCECGDCSLAAAAAQERMLTSVGYHAPPVPSTPGWPGNVLTAVGLAPYRR